MTGVQEVLAERYELLDVLGRGGMGVVYRARDRVLERVVAVKVLPLDRAQDPTFVARFEREARAVAALSHRNIVAVFDSGADGDTRFIVMEYLPGQSLAELLQERGAFGSDRAVSIAVQIASALSAAHRAGIVHRDIKPANVMLDEHGHVKVLDFGIARLAAAAALTQTATVLGSAPYLAPELSRGAPADARSDLYALGCVLYELLTGRPPFVGEMPAAVISQHLSDAPRRPDALDPAVPAGLSALTMRLLAKDPARRPQSAEAVLEALPATLSRAGAPAGLAGRGAAAAAAAAAAGAAGPGDPGSTAPTARVPSSAAATTRVQPAAAATTRVQPAAAATTRVQPAGDTASTEPIPPAAAGAWAEAPAWAARTRSFTGGRLRTLAMAIAAALIAALIVTLVSLASGGSAGGGAGGSKLRRTATHHSAGPTAGTHSSGVSAGSTVSGTPTTVAKTKPKPQAQQPKPPKHPAKVPGDHQPGPQPPGDQHSGGGPHGLPPGQARKLGDQGQNDQ